VLLLVTEGEGEVGKIGAFLLFTTVTDGTGTVTAAIAGSGASFGFSLREHINHKKEQKY
jgi:hypothetical protein